jgi:regulator of PEP synthase PpsR (kinase-PPPase family)
MPRKIKRTAFFVSDGTGLTAEALGHSLMTQFEDVEFKQIRIPFLDNVAKAHDAVARINAQGEIDGMRAIVFTTLVDAELAAIVHQADAFCLSYFETFLAPLEAELGTKSSHTVGRSHTWIQPVDATDWLNRSAGVS